ncbi:GNAT family N-acetyltransferase [Pseudokineococcus sp. 1T1Z-3]|uniref:GNAT family N-acetyltransferase n=1 Tax=Pseudokineococcus sp. 1T1Z-3 TaxID=3132745 RepID=UPI0030B4685B
MPEPDDVPRAAVVPFDLPQDVDLLTDFLTAAPWPFHVRSRSTAEDVRRSVDEGRWSGATTSSWWVLVGVVRAGLLRLDDVGDGTPLFDLRVDAGHRGRGVGTAAVRWAAEHLFTREPGLTRVEATTRVDNAAMRRVLGRCGFVQESQWRASWPDDAGGVHDGVGDGLLRTDWLSGTTTPVDWSR